MIFTDSDHNFRIELNNPFECHLSILNEDMRLLHGVNRMLVSYVRSAPLDGGEPVKFNHQLDGTRILVNGDISGAISALYELDWIQKSLRDDTMEQVMIMITAQISSRISPTRHETLAEKLNTTLKTTEQSHYSPGVFS